MRMRDLSMSMFLNKQALDDARAEAAVNEIRAICSMLFNGYGEDIHPAEQLTMIRGVLKEYEGVK